MTRTLFLRSAQDLTQGFAHWRIWSLLAWQEIRLRYRRSVLGPFWITLSMGVMVGSMGFLYGKIFGLELAHYYPYLSSGLITWSFISTLIGESVDVFTQNAHFIKQIKLPYTVYILKMIFKNNIILLHNLLVMIPVILIFNIPFGATSLIFLVMNLILLNIIVFPYIYSLCILGARFLDFKQITLSLIQIIFLLTPIMWMPSMVPHRMSFIADLNPIYHCVSLLREPLMGAIPSGQTYLFLLAMGAMGFFIMKSLLWRARHRISFWI